MNFTKNIKSLIAKFNSHRERRAKETENLLKQVELLSRARHEVEFHNRPWVTCEHKSCSEARKVLGLL